MEFENSTENINLLITKMADPLVFNKICSTYSKRKRKSVKQEPKLCEINKKDKKYLIFNEAEECKKILPFSVETLNASYLKHNQCQKFVHKECNVPTPVQKSSDSSHYLLKSKQNDLQVLRSCSKDPNCFSISETKVTHFIDDKKSKTKHASKQAKYGANRAKEQNSTLENIVLLSSDNTSEDEAINDKKCASNSVYCKRNNSFPSPMKINRKDGSRLSYSNVKSNYESTKQNNSSSRGKNSLTDSESFESKNTASRTKSTSKLNRTLPPELEVLYTTEGSQISISNLKNAKSFNEKNKNLKLKKAEPHFNFSKENNTSVFSNEKSRSVPAHSFLNKVDLVTLSSDSSEEDKKRNLKSKRKDIKSLNRKFKHSAAKYNTLKNQSKSRHVCQNRTPNSLKISNAEDQHGDIVLVSDELNNCNSTDVTPLFTRNDSSDSSFYEGHNSNISSNKPRTRCSSAIHCKRNKTGIAKKVSSGSKPVKLNRPTKFSAVKCKTASKNNIQDVENNMEIRESLNASVANNISANQESDENSIEVLNGDFVDEEECLNEIQIDAKKSLLLDSKKVFAPGRFTLKSTVMDTWGSPFQLKDLDFVPEPVTFKIPKLHENERVYWLSKEDQQKFADECIDIKLGRFSPEEDKILKRNFWKFCRDFGINDPDFLLGINNDLKRDSMLCQFLRAKHFYLRLGRDLDNRTLNSIYRRARKLFCSINSRKFGFKDVSKLIQLQRQLGNEWHVIGKMLRRDSVQCKNVFLYLKKSNKLDKIFKKCIK